MDFAKRALLAGLMRLPDGALKVANQVESALAAVCRRLARRRRRAASGEGGRVGGGRRFLCFLGRQWYNDFLLRQLGQRGHYAFSRGVEQTFGDWAPNYAEYGAGELPIDEATSLDYVLIDSAFFVNRRRVFGHDVMHEFVKGISGRFAVPVIGIDHCDVILSKFLPKDVDCFDLVLKAQGLPRDRELMNWEIGVRYGLNRRQRIRRLREEERILSPAQIERFRLSFDLGCAAYVGRLPRPRRAAEPNDVFMVAAFDSLNRLEGLRICQAHFRTIGWLAKLEDGHPIVGIEDWKADPQAGRAEDREALVREARRLYEENRALFREARIPARLYRMLARSCKVMPALSGIGELGMRHYQAFEFQKAMVCEDLSHVETIFPFEDGVNCLYVADRLEDLEERIRFLLEHEEERRRMARKGFEQLRATYGDGDTLFEQYFLRHLDGAREGEGD